MLVTNTENLTVTFNSFDISEYELFLKAKRLPEFNIALDENGIATGIVAPARYASLLGIEKSDTYTSDLPLPEFLFEHQKAIVQLALTAKRFALWGDCGVGKTVCELEFGRQVIHKTGGRALLITLNDVVSEIVDEAKKFYTDLQLHIIKSRQEMREWCTQSGPAFGITNYEKLNPDEQGQIVHELKHLACLIVDENRLKGGGAKQKWALIHSSKGIEYKLSATATPAPNDVIEFASQASFLERMRSENEIIWTYFAKDKDTGEWTVKRHAKQAFFEWMAAWSIYLRDPARYGWVSSYKQPPEPEIIYHKIAITEAQSAASLIYNPTNEGQQNLFAVKSQGIVGRNKLSQIAKGFVYEKVSGKQTANPIESRKPQYVADLIKSETEKGLQVLVWTVFDEETEIIARILGHVAELREETSAKLRFAKSEYFRVERDFFQARDNGELSEKYKSGIERKKEFDCLLKSFGEAIEELQLELSQIEGFEFSQGKDFEVLSGKTPKEKRAEILERFRKDELPVLISKASLLGYGMNFQNCGSMIFSGFTDSFEQLYQAIRRAVRFGQEKAVRVHFPYIEELEGDQLNNIFRKEKHFLESIMEQETAYIKAMERLRLLEATN